MKKAVLMIIAIIAFFASAFATVKVYQYGQCGGQGYTGPTVCASPYSCIVINQFYSQCQ